MSTPALLRQMRGFLQARYERFAFLFDTSTSADVGPGVELPAGPTAAAAGAGREGARSPTKKEQRETTRADRQSGGQSFSTSWEELLMMVCGRGAFICVQPQNWWPW